MQVEVEQPVTSDRRERFREYMQGLNPTAPAQAVINLGLVFGDLHESLYKTLAARADLDPGSQQLLVGGIGSGKTTELLLTETWLREQFRSVCLYIDVSSETDLSDLNSGVLLASFGLHLLRAFGTLGLGPTLSAQQTTDFNKAKEELKLFAFGKTEPVWVSDDYDDSGSYDEDPTGYYSTRTIPGKLQPQFPALQRDIKEIRKILEFFATIFKAKQLDLVVIFDGLDRLLAPEKFWSVVHQDLKSLRGLGVAVLIAAPLAILYGSGKPIAEHFDRVHHIPAVLVDPGKTTRLRAVLVGRGAAKLAHRAEIDKIAKASGGVLRDLISLARDAGEAAYLDGNDEVTAVHVRAASRQLGESYLRGLGIVQLRLLRKLAKDRSINISTPVGIELLVTRRVLEYSATDFRVHPALLPLIRLKEHDA